MHEQRLKKAMKMMAALPDEVSIVVSCVKHLQLSYREAERLFRATFIS
jgi:transcriptional regulator GlxA family with amidase domain